MTVQKGGNEGGRRGFISHSHARIWMAISRKPSARLTHHLKLVTRQRFLRFSILKETSAAPQGFLVPLCPVKNPVLPHGASSIEKAIQLGGYLR
jgi:hypothetical protein